jgi:hypothetical protein
MLQLLRHEASDSQTQTPPPIPSSTVPSPSGSGSEALSILNMRERPRGPSPEAEQLEPAEASSPKSIDDSYLKAWRADMDEAEMSERNIRGRIELACRQGTHPQKVHSLVTGR